MNIDINGGVCLRVNWLGDTYYGKTVNVDQNSLKSIDGESAMNMVFQSEHECVNFVPLYFNKNSYPLHVCNSSQSIDFFVGDDVDFYFIDKEYLRGLLNG